MKKAALFCDETLDYRQPEEPDAGDAVTIKFRTAKDDVDAVYMIIDGEEEKIRMERCGSEGLFDFLRPGSM